jgi:hypothetical protein
MLKKFLLIKREKEMRLSSIVGLLSVSLALYAKEVPPSPPPILQKCPPPASVCKKVAFEVFGEWLYLQPNGSNLYYAAEAFPYDLSIADPPVSPNWQIFEIDPDFHSGFDAGLRFLLIEKDMRLALDWERLHAEDVSSMNVTPISYATGNMVGPIYDIGPNSSSYKVAKGKGVFKFDEVNLVVEKSICFVSGLIVDLDLGVSFARIEQKVASFYANPGAATNREIDAISSYWGIGPQFRLGLDYCICDSFYFTGKTAGSIYLGRIKNTANYQSSAPGLVFIGVAAPNTQQTTIPHRTQLIPGFEEKLGFSYVKSFQKSRLNLEVGYQFQIYLNAVQSMDMLTQAVPGFDPGNLPPFALFALTFNRTLSNFMLSGPYVSLDIGF